MENIWWKLPHFNSIQFNLNLNLSILKIQHVDIYSVFARISKQKSRINHFLFRSTIYKSFLIQHWRRTFIKISKNFWFFFVTQTRQWYSLIAVYCFSWRNIWFDRIGEIICVFCFIFIFFSCFNNRINEWKMKYTWDFRNFYGKINIFFAMPGKLTRLNILKSRKKKIGLISKGKIKAFLDKSLICTYFRKILRK